LEECAVAVVITTRLQAAHHFNILIAFTAQREGTIASLISRILVQITPVTYILTNEHKISNITYVVQKFGGRFGCGCYNNQVTGCTPLQHVNSIHNIAWVNYN
jgi:hypothetical protein